MGGDGLRLPWTRSTARTASPTTSRRPRSSTCCCATRCSSAITTSASGCTRTPGSTRPTQALRGAERRSVPARPRQPARQREPLPAAVRGRSRAITGSADADRWHEFIARQLGVAVRSPSTCASSSRRSNGSKDQPTARLERAFADHIDCCAYRLDAWMLGLVNYQLALMRNIRDGEDGRARQGIYLGAYAWLEDVAARAQGADAGAPDGSRPGRRDFAGADRAAARARHHQPGLHPRAVAEPRRGRRGAAQRLSSPNASPANRQTMAVNLTSERVRTALGDDRRHPRRAEPGRPARLPVRARPARPPRPRRGRQVHLQAAQGVPAAGRPDRARPRPTEGVLDRGDRGAQRRSTAWPSSSTCKATATRDLPVRQGTLPAGRDAAEADGDQRRGRRACSKPTTPSPISRCPRASTRRCSATTTASPRTYDAYARGNFPPEPDVVRTPLNGIGLTHRVALHLEAGVDPTVSPDPGLPMTPRAQAEPALNEWLAAMLPPLGQSRLRW